MSYVWDIMIIAVVAVCAFLACKKGLISTLFGLLGTVVSMVLALLLKGVVGAFINDAFVAEPVRRFVLSTVSGAPCTDYESMLQNTDVLAKIKEMPEALSNLLKMLGISASDVLNTGSAATQNAKNQLIDSIAGPISATISTAIAFILLFVIFSLLCMVAAKLLTALCSILPFGKKLNKIGGGIVGACKGLIIVLILSAVVSAVSLGIQPQSDHLFSEKTIGNTVLLKEVNKINPICKAIIKR